jgi:Protein of unknown function (DUF3307)
MEQFILHLFGDYITQSDWMATNKTKDLRIAFTHAAIYSLPFLFLTRSIPAMAVIFFTHAAIDRYALARYVVFAKNYVLSPRQSWKVLGPRMAWDMCKKTGYPRDEPVWLFVWLLIIADNTMHLAINYAALRWL